MVLPPEVVPIDAIALAVESETDDCVIWSRSKDAKGYGRLSVKGRYWKAHHLVLELTGRQRPSGYQGLHSCHVSSCINPRHLHWGTAAENRRDQLQNGTYGSRLTPVLVEVIRFELDWGFSHAEIARRYGCHRSSVTSIAGGKQWAIVQ